MGGELPAIRVVTADRTTEHTALTSVVEPSARGGREAVADGGEPWPRSVVIVGGGFAGLACAKHLAKDASVQVTLIDRLNYSQFQPLLYQVATAQLGSSDVASPLRTLSIKHPNVAVKLADVVSVDPATRTATTCDG